MHQTRHTFCPGVDLMVSAGSIFHAGVAHTTESIYTTDALSGLLNGLLSVCALKNSIEIGFIQGLTMVMPTNEDCPPELEPMSTWPLPTLTSKRKREDPLVPLSRPVGIALFKGCRSKHALSHLHDNPMDIGTSLSFPSEFLSWSVDGCPINFQHARAGFSPASALGHFMTR